MASSRHKTVRLNTGVDHRARKRFGQNFLHDQGIIDRIIQQLNPKKENHLLEVGPGQGALTSRLASVGARLDCIELDRDLAAHLQNEYRQMEHVTIHQRDILKTRLKEFAETNSGEKLRIIGNLPYNISTPVLFHLLKEYPLIEDMVFMLQLEVVQRMSASMGGKNYGRLGLMLQYYCKVEHLFNAPSAAFTPRPKVSSAIVRLTPHEVLPVQAQDAECLQTVIRTAFNQRRKTLRNSMKPLLGDELLNSLAVDASLRPENLSLADFVLIADALSSQQ